MKICFLEDSSRFRYAPLTLIRPEESLFFGMMTIEERWHHYFKQADWYSSTPFPLSIKWALPKSDDYLAINPIVVPDENLVSAISKLSVGQILVKDDVIIAAHTRLEAGSFKAIDKLSFSEKIEYKENAFILRHIWDIVKYNGALISSDFELLKIKDNRDRQTFDSVIISGKYPVYISPTAVLEPGTIIFAEEGPVYISDEAKVLVGAHIRGPFFMGNHSVIKMGAHIYKDTSIGNYCKVGGEVNGCIIQSYSNKSHSGYLGNSIIGQWCNLGAGTNGSNLKNTYSNIRVKTFPDGEETNSGMQFLGVMMGDHCKLGINTSINTGSMIGPFCNIVQSSFPSKFIRSFSWLTDNGVDVFDVEKIIEIESIVFERRGYCLTEVEKELFRTFFRQSVLTES